MKTTTYHRWFWGLLLAAIALRLGVLWEFLSGNPFADILLSDDYVYWREAGYKAAGVWSPDDPFLSAPLYPYLLGAIRYLGGTLTSVFTLQLLLNVLAMVLVATAARRRFGDFAALAALVLFGFTAELAMHFTRVMPETLQVLLAALLILSWGWQPRRETSSWLGILGAGMALGLLALSWEPALLLVPVYALDQLLRGGSWSRRLGSALAGTLVAIAIISPATWHNWRTDHSFIPVSADIGINLALGNNEHAKGYVSAIRGVSPNPQTLHLEMKRYYRNAQGRDGSWSQIDRLFRDKAVDYWRQFPRESLVLLARKGWWFLTSRQYDNSYVTPLMRELGLYQALVLAPIELPWLMGLALLGILACRRCLPELATLGLTFLACVLFHYSARYRLPAAPALVILSAGALGQWSALPLREWARWVLALLPLPLLIINYYTGLTSVDFLKETTAYQVSQAWLESGDLRVADGRPAAALERYARAVKAKPENLTPHLRLALLYGHQGKLQQAINSAETAIPLVGDNLMLYELEYNLYRQKGKFDRALQVLDRAIKTHPRHAELYQARLWLLATCVQDPHAIELGIQTFRNILKDAGASSRPAVMASLALALAHDGQQEEAKRLAQEAVKLAARDEKRNRLTAIRQITFPIRAGREVDCQAGQFKLPRSPWDKGFVHPMRRTD